MIHPVNGARRRAAALLLTGALAAGTAVAAATGPATAAAPDGAPIRLLGAEFVPTAGQLAKVPNGLAARELSEGTKGTYLVQFRGPVLEQWLADLAATGAEVLDYVPDFAVKTRMSPAQARQVERLDQVGWVGRFQPAWKLDKQAKQLADNAKPSLYRVVPEQGADLAGLRAEIGATGAVVSRAGAESLLVAASGTQLTRVALSENVAWVEPFRMQEKHNEHAAGVIMRGKAANTRGYDGSTQIVAVADTGLGGGTAATAHTDVPATRITAVHDWPAKDIPDCAAAKPDGAVDVDSGHGTHTAVSVVGGGDATGLGKAAANKAKLVFQAVEDYADIHGQCEDPQLPDGYYLLGLPQDLGDLFQQAYTDGARVHSNSWGASVAGQYTTEAADADRFANTHRDMLITFSAGNSGVDANSDGVIDNDSMGSPATAKNVLAVGASENARPSVPCDRNLAYLSTSPKELATTGNRSCKQLGGTQPLPTWGAWWPDNYPANPLKDDVQAGNAQQMATFSSRGPTDDGRIKPDVVAPGSWIASGYSDLYQRGYDAKPNPRNGAWQHDGYGYPISDKYKYFSGTSMSNPLAAGGAAVVRDFYHKHHKHTAASSALVKATLINSADDLLDENNDGVNDNDFPIPNAHEGWGRVNLDRATAGDARYVDEGAGLTTGQTREFSYPVTSGRPLKVTLGYTDAPSTSAAAVNLVNDLDLELVAPNGTVHKGNVFERGWSKPGGAADRRNNVENVYVRAPAAGTWKVRVKGYNVPKGPQRFAMVVRAGFSTANVAPVVGNPGEQRTSVGAPVTLKIDATDANGDQLTFTATGLPAGLVIAADGVISGKPTAHGRSSVTVTVTDGKGGSAAAAFSWIVTIELLRNPGFEAGATEWTGDTAVIVRKTDDLPPHGGSWLAALGGKGSTSTRDLVQQVAIPVNVTSANLAYWVRITTAELSPTAYDTLTLQVLDNSGAVLGTLGTLSNLDSRGVYERRTHSLLAYKGKTVQLRWRSTEDYSAPTGFSVDDTSLVVG